VSNSQTFPSAIRSKIYTIRGINVMLDRDLAELYEVETKYLKRQVKRNLKRFPEDFMFRLSLDETNDLLRCQNVTLKPGSHSKYAAYAFTEHGVAMLSSVLRSSKAIEVNIAIIRAFIEMRKIATVNPEYEILRETISRIEADIQVENTSIRYKVSQLSQKVGELSALFDEFQNTHIVIKRPEDGAETLS